jgi:hypothetical protein
MTQTMATEISTSRAPPDSWATNTLVVGESPARVATTHAGRSSVASSCADRAKCGSLAERR